MATIARYGEIGTKSDYVRRKMETILIKNIKSYLQEKGIKTKVRNLRGRIYIDENVELNQIIGVVSYSIVKESSLNLEEIYKTAYSIYRGKKFRITSKRMNKNFPMTSQEINQKVGEYIFNKGGKVSLTEFDQEIFVEILGNKAFIFDLKKWGVGGLPLGGNGKMLAIVNSEEDEYAALLMMKRGVKVDTIGVCDLMKKWAYGYKPKELKEIPENVFETYLGIVIGNRLENSSDLEEYKKMFKKYKYIHAPLIGYNLNELKKVWNV